MSKRFEQTPKKINRFYSKEKKKSMSKDSQHHLSLCK